MRVLLVHNPTSGGGEVGAEELCRLVRAAGHDVRYTTTDDDWSSALAGDLDLVAAAGGDGTVRTVLVELHDVRSPAAILPLGTANNIARALDIPAGDPAPAIRAWGADARTRRLDVPMLGAPVGTTPFVEALGGGIFADLLRRADRAEDVGATDGGLRAGRQMLVELLRADPTPRHWIVRIDGHDVSGDYTAVEVVNTGLVGPRVGISASSDPGDGLLEVVVVDPSAHEEMARHLEAAHDGDVVRLGGAGWCGRSVELVPPPHTTLHVDDEVIDERTEGSWRVSLGTGDQVTIVG